jgi:hypothetical protein
VFARLPAPVTAIVTATIVAGTDPVRSSKRRVRPIASVPIIACTDRVILTGNPGITVPGCRVGRSGVAIDRNRRRRSIIVAATETHAEKYSWTSEHATASQQKKGKNFCFHLKLLAALICKSFAKLK